MLKQCFILSDTIIKVLCTQVTFFPFLLGDREGLMLQTSLRLPSNSLSSQVSFELCTLPRSQIIDVNHLDHLLFGVLHSCWDKVLLVWSWLVWNSWKSSCLWLKVLELWMCTNTQKNLYTIVFHQVRNISLGYITRPCLNKTKTKQTKQKPNKNTQKPKVLVSCLFKYPAA